MTKPSNDSLQDQIYRLVSELPLAQVESEKVSIQFQNQSYLLCFEVIFDDRNSPVAILAALTNTVINNSLSALLSLAVENLSLSYNQTLHQTPVSSELNNPVGLNLQNFINSFQEHIWIKNLNGQYVVCNESVDLAWNKKHSDIIGKYDEELFDSATAELFKSGDFQAIKANEPIVVGECERIDQQQKRHWLETIKAPLLDSNNELVGVIGITRNIGRHKEAQTQLMLAESVFENTKEGVLVTDRDGQITEVNAAFSKITGFSREEAVGQNPRILNSGTHDDLFFRKCGIPY
ncbi:PAS domain-containing protein [Shewanella olleyana]|uniref:PAS domain-containing protein n=1 Tax=Shewanella olleyana TaxID=135626 RepID=UPI00200E9F5C|nr:PAS domain-containing protein [Shewanella olleyana]MCL1068351.1 PAS domain-containing protein [Shewanella olleyana]